MTPQRLVLDGAYPDGVWSCAWCAAELTEGVISHRDDCRWLAEIRGTAGAEITNLRDALKKAGAEMDRRYEMGAAAERAKLQHAIDRVARLAEAAQEKAVAAAVAAERERIAASIGVKMHRQPHGHAGFADGWETAASYAQEIARNPDCEVAPLADLVRQMRLKAGKPSSTPRDYFEDGRAAERERLTAMAEKVDAHSWYDDDGSGIAVKVPFADVIRKDAAP